MSFEHKKRPHCFQVLHQLSFIGTIHTFDIVDPDCCGAPVQGTNCNMRGLNDTQAHAKKRADINNINAHYVCASQILHARTAIRCPQFSCDTIEDKRVWMQFISAALHVGPIKQQPSVPRYSSVLGLKTDTGETRPMSSLKPRDIAQQYKKMALLHHPDRYLVQKNDYPFQRNGVIPH